MTGTDITSYEQQWADAAKRAAKAEPPPQGQFFSIKGGTLSLGEIQMPGNQACVIILDSVRENTYYEGKYTEGENNPPVCYAYGRDGGEMAPHNSMRPYVEQGTDANPSFFKPQHFPCIGCWANEWGSADQGRGKACQERRRLTMIPAGMYSPRPKSRDFDLTPFDDPAHYADASVAMLRLPVTSVNGWAQYLNQISATLHRPPHGVITHIEVVPDPKSQYKVLFECLGLVPDELASVIMDRNAAQEQMPFTGYQPPDEAKEQGQAKMLAGLRRPGG